MSVNPAAALVAKRWAKAGERKKQAQRARELNESLRGTPQAKARAKKAARARHAKSQSATKVSKRDAKKQAPKRQSP